MAEFEIPKDAGAQFEERGYFVVRNIIEPDAVSEVRDEIARIIEENAEGFNLDRKRIDRAQLGGADGVRAVRDGNFLSRILWERWLTSQHVIEINRRFVGDNVRVQGTRFFTKPARVGEPTPWHQDFWLWTQGPNKNTRPYKKRHLSCWVALDRVDLENGCLHVVPGIHKGGVIEHVKYEDSVHEEIPRELLANKTPGPVPLGPGDAVIWEANMWHMSPGNTSDRTRWGGVMVTLPDEMAEGAKQADRPFIVKAGKACPYPDPCAPE